MLNTCMVLSDISLVQQTSCIDRSVVCMGRHIFASMSLKILIKNTLSSNPNLHEDIMSTLRALPWNLKNKKQKKKKLQKKNKKVTSLHLFCCIYYHFKSLPFLWQNILYSRRRKMCDIMDFLDSYTFISHL